MNKNMPKFSNFKNPIIFGVCFLFGWMLSPSIYTYFLNVYSEMIIGTISIGIIIAGIVALFLVKMFTEIKLALCGLGAAFLIQLLIFMGYIGGVGL